MKTSIQSFTIFTFLFFATLLSAQTTDGKYSTVTLQVPGVCDMCKARIETTTYDVTGVKEAKWDLETEVLTAVINPKKTSRQKIADALALAGYRSELAEADLKAYNKLPACCQYDSGIDKHGKE
jgi:copper chaperone CopZ